jgi:16S rRNA (adenine1518-N6/adenine1519-N6)-dimethyltransferase
VFLPQPKVDSALVAIERREVPAGPPGVAPAELFSLVRAGFGQRRKTLRRSLAGLAVEEDFVAAGVDPGARAEQLDVEAWGRLVLAVRARSGGGT